MNLFLIAFRPGLSEPMRTRVFAAFNAHQALALLASDPAECAVFVDRPILLPSNNAVS